MQSEIFIVPRLLVHFPGMPGLLQGACQKADAQNSGLPVSQLLTEVSDFELYELLLLCEKAHQDRELMQALGIFCAMLAMSEGLVVLEDDDLGVFVTRLSVLGQAESLCRQGLLALDPATMTLDEFDVARVPKTPLGEHTISSISVQLLPRG